MKTFLHKPQTVRARRVLFQIHLWLGVIVGLYVLVVSVTGAALVFRIDMQRAMFPHLFYPRVEGVPAEPAAHYTVRATLTGFKTVVQEHIRLQVAETKTINVTLEAGQVQEQVTVSGAAPLVETSQGRVSGLIEENQVRDLPLVGRSEELESHLNVLAERVLFS